MQEQQPSARPPAVPVHDGPEGRVVDSVPLFAGRREVLIRHRGEIYRLRLTGANKLILVK